jgi:hypothetical protein
MKRFIEGEGRHQVMLVPECLDDFIAEDDTVLQAVLFAAEAVYRALVKNGRWLLPSSLTRNRRFFETWCTTKEATPFIDWRTIGRDTRQAP